MFRLSVASRALEMLNNGAARKAGIELKRVVCDTQTHSIPVEVKVGTKKKMEKKEFSGGAVTLTLRTTNPIKANHLVGALAELVHGQPNSSHQWTLRQLDEAFTKTGKLKKSQVLMYLRYFNFIMKKTTPSPTDVR